MSTPDPPTRRAARAARDAAADVGTATTDAEPSVLTELATASDRVPTKWFASIGAVAFLIATAGFGGFADVPPTPIPALELGAAHASAQVTLEVQNVVVVDDIPELYLTVPPGERVVAVLAHATNAWTEPQAASVTLSDVLRLDVDGLEEERPLVIARVDDAIANPRLQPGLRVPLAFVWTVPSVLLSDGDEVSVEVFDQTLYTGKAVTNGRWWDDPVLAATVTVPVEDLGTGEVER